MKHNDLQERLDKAEETIGHRFANRDLLLEALTHRSFANESKDDDIPDNDRLEYVGDAVIDLVVAQMLYKRYPDFSSGEMTKLRAAVVCEATLADIARELALGELIMLGVGEERTGGAEKSSILSDMYEAVIGAVFLDGGYNDAAARVRTDIQPHIKDHDSGVGEEDHKSVLQEFCAKRHMGLPHYKLEGRSGPDHDTRFRVSVSVGHAVLGSGKGRSIKLAEQAAAGAALDALQSDTQEEGGSDDS